MYVSTLLLSSDTPKEGIQSLYMVVSHHVVAGTWTQDLWKSSRCSFAEQSLQPCFKDLDS